MSYRCSKCRGRNRLTRKPEHYIRLPKCKACGRKMHAHPVYRTDPHYVLDNYRLRHERGRGATTCWPGRGGCNAYHYPHRRGSGFCWHHPTRSDAELATRGDVPEQEAHDPDSTPSWEIPDDVDASIPF